MQLDTPDTRTLVLRGTTEEVCDRLNRIFAAVDKVDDGEWTATRITGATLVLVHRTFLAGSEFTTVVGYLGGEVCSHESWLTGNPDPHL